MNNIDSMKAENDRLKCSVDELLAQRNKLLDENTKLEKMLKEAQKTIVEDRMMISRLEGAVEAYRYCAGRC